MKKKLIRLTESDLHRIVEDSVKRIIKEGYRRNDGKVLMIGDIIQNNEEGYNSMKDFAKDYLHNADFSDAELYWENMPKYYQFVESYKGIEMFYDYGADYYFFVASNEYYNDLNKRGFLDGIDDI